MKVVRSKLSFGCFVVHNIGGILIKAAKNRIMGEKNPGLDGLDPADFPGLTYNTMGRGKTNAVRCGLYGQDHVHNFIVVIYVF